MGASASAEGVDVACTSITRATCKPSELQKRQMIADERKRKNGLMNAAKRRRHMERHMERIGEKEDLASPTSSPMPWTQMCAAFDVAPPSGSDSSDCSLGERSAGSVTSSEEELEHGSFISSKKALTSDSSMMAMNPRGTTPLMQACALGGQAALEIVKDLLATGADLRARDYQRWTCFLHACRSGCEPVVRLLLSKGSSTSERTNDDKTAMMLACMGGHSDVLRTLLQSFDNKVRLVQKLRMVDKSGSTALHYACRMGSAKCVKMLLQHGAPHSAADNDGMLPLMIASELGKAHCIDHLLENGAKTSAVDNNGRSALHHACFHGHDSVAVSLLEHGSDPSLEDSLGETPHELARSMNLRKFFRACERHNLELEKERERERQEEMERSPLQGS